MFSSAARYAVRALIHLALQPEGQYQSAHVIAHKLDISGPFLAKILKRLVDAEMVSSQRGPRGGLRLAKHPGGISVRDVVLAIDGDGLFTACLLGLPGCGHEAPCPMHASWTITRSALEQSLAAESIAELTEGVEAGEKRVSP